VERCRFLEVGCAGATNLVAMAGGLPESTFVGIDASQRHVSEARETIEQLGRRNVTVEHRDLRDLRQDDGEFDYIVAHGLYSWIPTDTR
jgi:cyclopropane fatty-acyl-phospholipid synthase-like methyltransferase